MNRRLLMSIFLLTTACACHGSLAHAELIVTVSNLNLPEGGSEFVDVMISSDDDSDVLDFFTIFLLISPGDASQLEFVDPVSDTYLAKPDYLFAGDSDALEFGFAGALDSSTLYIGGDGTLSKEGVPVRTTPQLLVRLGVTAFTSSPPMPGDTFTISVLIAEFFKPLDLDTPIPFTSSPGTVTITSRSAVIPEPASMAIWAILLAVLVIGMGRRQASE